MDSIPNHKYKVQPWSFAKVLSAELAICCFCSNLKYFAKFATNIMSKTYHWKNKASCICRPMIIVGLELLLQEHFSRWHNHKMFCQHLLTSFSINIDFFSSFAAVCPTLHITDKTTVDSKNQTYISLVIVVLVYSYNTFQPQVLVVAFYKIDISYSGRQNQHWVFKSNLTSQLNIERPCKNRALF